MFKWFFRKVKSNNEIEVVYKVSWWSYQDQMSISSMKLESDDIKMTLFKAEESLHYEIVGTLKGKEHWRPYIANVHISERFLHPDPYMPINSFAERDHNVIEETFAPEALITITPIVKVERDENYQEELIEFGFRNELIIHSFHWGENQLRIQCRDIYKDIYWQQIK
jgi:hypothetical protein